MGVIFITGIDTESGKTITTGLLARYLLKQGKSVITQKLVQTGNEGISEDIKVHRKIMGIDLTEDDKSGITCPFVFKNSVAPTLAASMEKRTIEPDAVTEATKKLAEKYDYVLLEGAGGILVPLNNEIMVLDYVEMQKYPVIIVSTTKIGSINHTLLTFDAIWRRELEVLGLAYNHFPEQKKEIIDDTRNILERTISQQWFDAVIIDIPPVFFDAIPDIDFSAIF